MTASRAGFITGVFAVRIILSVGLGMFVYAFMRQFIPTMSDLFTGIYTGVAMGVSMDWKRPSE